MGKVKVGLGFSKRIAVERTWYDTRDQASMDVGDRR